MMRSGLWPVPIELWAKRPIGKAWGTAYATRGQLLSVFDRHKGAGVGVLLGPDAGVVDVEVDDEAAAASLLARVELPETLGWTSARGAHRLFLWDKRLAGLPTVAHLGGTELRLGQEGKQLVSVCPPSVGDDRRRRRWSGVWEVRAFPECLLREMERPGARPDSRPIAVPTGGSRYAAAALRYEVQRVAKAKAGTRNACLNKAAFSLGGLVAVGLLTRETVEEALSDAALVAGLGEAEVAATINSGLSAGIRRPRRL
jgi:hypothetical protein